MVKKFTRQKIDGLDYLTINEIAFLSDTSPATLRQWLDKNELAHVLTVYQSDTNQIFCRMGQPLETDERIPGDKIRYHLPKPSEENTFIKIIKTYKEVGELT